MLNIVLTLQQISESLPVLEDSDIIAIAKSEEDALQNFYKKAKNSIYGFALSITKNKYDAEDVLQETVLVVYSNANKYECQGKPMAWVLTIAKNLALAKFREQKKQQSFSESIGYNVQDFSHIESLELRLIIEAVFTTLSDEERSIVTLKTVSGLHFREIASLLSLPIGTVLSKYHRAVKKLQQNISGRL